MSENGKSLKIMKILYIINIIPLLPCAFMTLLKAILGGILVSHAILGLTLPVVLLRCFYLPYITSAIVSVVYLCVLIKNKFPLKETIIFVTLLIICILGLLSVEDVFWAAMGV